MDFGFEKIMEFAMKIDKLNMANLVLVGKVMDKITKRLPNTIFKGKNCKTSLSIRHHDVKFSMYRSAALSP